MVAVVCMSSTYIKNWTYYDCPKLKYVCIWAEFSETLNEHIQHNF